jgi:hypothetical protein
MLERAARLATLCIVAGLSLPLTACANAVERPPTLTSAPVEGMTLHGELASQLEIERDQAQRRVHELEAAAAAQHERSDNAMRALMSRNEFEALVWSRLDRLEARLNKMRALASPANRPHVAALSATTREKSQAIERQMRHVHDVPPVAWESFQREILSSVNAMARETENDDRPPRFARAP